MFLDADDAFLPELMQRVVDSLEEHPAQAVCWGLVEDTGRRTAGLRHERRFSARIACWMAGRSCGRW